ncbi:hypothetical protein DFJ73DRAFT_20086 [Zopfochytrium polystomum]|nr:hypothetical protein DFJ73DRAFT_20086 [Zopfochytrium polystomum]
MCVCSLLAVRVINQSASVSLVLVCIPPPAFLFSLFCFFSCGPRVSLQDVSFFPKRQKEPSKTLNKGSLSRKGSGWSCPPTTCFFKHPPGSPQLAAPTKKKKKKKKKRERTEKTPSALPLNNSTPPS